MDCFICNSSSQILFQNLTDRVHVEIPGEYTLRKCLECGLMFIDPAPTEEKLMRHYPDDYHVYERKPAPVSLKKAFIIKQVANQYLGYGKSNWLKRFFLLPFYYKLIHLPRYQSKGKILDVGCGVGTRLPTFKLLGWEAEGLEINQKAANLANESGFEVFNGALDKFNGQKNNYNVVYLNNVFEHFLDPTQALKKIKEILQCNGKLILVLPNSNSLASKLFKRNWFGLEIPRHLFTYNKYNICKLLTKHDFEVEQVKYCYNFGSFSSSMALHFNQPISKFAFLDKLTWLMAFFLDPIMNFLSVGDWMVVHARLNTRD